jgi:hypothetical protein
VQVGPELDLAPIAAQAMRNDEVLDVALSVSDPNTPLADILYMTSANDYGFVLDQALSFVAYQSSFDNWGNLGEKWLKDAAGAWYIIHLDGASGKAMLRRWNGDAALADDPLVAELHRVYYDHPEARLVNPASIAWTRCSAQGHDRSAQRLRGDAPRERDRQRWNELR